MAGSVRPAKRMFSVALGMLNSCSQTLAKAFSPAPPVLMSVPSMSKRMRRIIGSEMRKWQRFGVEGLRTSGDADGDVFGGEELFDLGDGVLAEMENAGGENSVGFAIEEDFGHVFEGTGAATGDDGDGDGFADAASDRDVEPGASAVGIDAVEDDFAGAEGDGALGPFDGFEAGRFAATVGEDFPTIGRDALGIDGNDDALAAEFFRAGADEIGGGERGGIDADFIGAGFEHGVHVFDGADAAADGKGHKALVGGALNDIDHGGAAVGGRGDVEKNHFIGALVVVAAGELDGVADVAQLARFGAAELDAAGDLTRVDVQTGNDSARQH